MFVLGIESSCDDCCASVISGEGKILSNVISSQNAAHEPFGGVVPEIASRNHLSDIESVVSRALSVSGKDITEIGAIAATCGPGLIGGLIVGCMFGKALASALKKPFIAVNHLEGHALAVKLTEKVNYPYLLLSVSGGHCHFISVRGLGDYVTIGRSIDDAAGEAFDKAAKILGLPFPGGPEIEKRALLGDRDRYIFPKPILNQKNCDMSFSGLKTAFRLCAEKIGKPSETEINDLCAGFQYTIGEILSRKTAEAIKIYEKTFKEPPKEKIFVLSGGVAANKYLRNLLSDVCSSENYNFIAPDLKLCTDNAAMIAYAGLERLRAGLVDGLDFSPRARWPL